MSWIVVTGTTAIADSPSSEQELLQCALGAETALRFTQVGDQEVHGFKVPNGQGIILDARPGFNAVIQGKLQQAFYMVTPTGSYACAFPQIPHGYNEVLKKNEIDGTSARNLISFFFEMNGVPEMKDQIFAANLAAARDRGTLSDVSDPSTVKSSEFTKNLKLWSAIEEFRANPLSVDCVSNLDLTKKDNSYSVLASLLSQRIRESSHNFATDFFEFEEEANSGRSKEARHSAAKDEKKLKEVAQSFSASLSSACGLSSTSPYRDSIAQAIQYAGDTLKYAFDSKIPSETPDKAIGTNEVFSKNAKAD